ncbi:unnamed protein product, partial [Schistosoma curassoni]|uniref:Transcriptional regulator n=1 Tax=Schistosoma curassoni TaxID=6186 RepID=A0A183JPW1_9TREM
LGIIESKSGVASGPAVIKILEFIIVSDFPSVEKLFGIDDKSGTQK